MKRGLIAAVLVSVIFSPLPLHAATQKLLATVFDQPVTSRDVDQYIALQKLLGYNDISRQVAREDLINQVVKIEEAKLNKMQATEPEIDTRLQEIAKGTKTDVKGLEATLKKQGIGMRMMRQFVSAQIAFSRLLKFKYKAEFKIDDSVVDKRLNVQKSKIRAEIDGKVQAYMSQFDKLKPVTIYNLQEVMFPLEGGATEEVVQARAIDAIQYARNFKSCKNVKGPASGIFNVKYGRKLQADASKLPGPLKGVLDSKGPNNAYGPMRVGNALQVIAFCSKQFIKPPKPKRPDVKYPEPSRAAIAAQVEDEQYRVFEKRYLKVMRHSAIIEYKEAESVQ